MRTPTSIRSIFCAATFVAALTSLAANPEPFSQRKIVDDAEWWWALNIGDVTGDGIQDLVYINNNANGGYLAYRKGQTEPGLWKETVIAETPPMGGTFAAGDMETGDFDGDGDIDVFAVKHTGEWDDSTEAAELFWYENPSWKAYPIGDIKGALKDVSLADFDNDGLLDVATLTFHNENLRVFRQAGDGTFTLLQDITLKNLHEGMAVGDFDGDGFTDIVANGFSFRNPDGKLDQDWVFQTIHPRWHNQEGDWSRNGTKAAMADFNGDGRSEVVITHSERKGYPVSKYTYSSSGLWLEYTLLQQLTAGHTLQIDDFDLDGNLDLLAGVNKGRAVNLGDTRFPVLIFFNAGDHSSVEILKITDRGIYNGRTSDYDGDGDIDILRLPEHGSKEVFLLENTAR